MNNLDAYLLLFAVFIILPSMLICYIFMCIYDSKADNERSKRLKEECEFVRKKRLDSIKEVKE